MTPAEAPANAPGPLVLQGQIRDFTKRKNVGSFQTLFQRWEKDYGTTAVGPLLKVARNFTLADPERYIAVMGAAKLGGTGVAPLLSPFLKDKSWMVRNAALRALAALKNPETGTAVLPLLKDPALVVRVEAIEAVKALKPVGSTDALVRAALAAENYHGGKAQWVPQKALQALVALQARDAAPKLRPLLDKSNDPALQSETVRTLQALFGSKAGEEHARGPASLALNEPLDAQVRHWKAELSRLEQ